jgi:hypothetical protein
MRIACSLFQKLACLGFLLSLACSSDNKSSHDNAGPDGSQPDGSSRDGSQPDSAEPNSDGSADLPKPACDATKSGGSKNVNAPALVATLFDSWHESWLGSPAVADLDGDGTMEIIAARSNLVLAWHLDGKRVLRLETEGSRIWSSPVVADLVKSSDGLEIAAASRASIYLWNARGELMPGFPFTWQGELRSLAAGDIDGMENSNLSQSPPRNCHRMARVTSSSQSTPTAP